MNRTSSLLRSTRARRALSVILTASAASFLGACAAPVSDGESASSTISEALHAAAPCPPRIAQIAAGNGETTYALTTEGVVYAWGSNNMAALGNGDLYAPPALAPVRVPVGTAKQIAANVSGACALLVDSTVSCWGLESEDGWSPVWNASPQTMLVLDGLVANKPLTDVIGIAEGQGHACAWKNDGTVWCWGNDGKGETGDPTLTTTAYAAGQVPGIDDAIDVVASHETTCVLRRSGDVVCFGSNDDGELANGTIGEGEANATPVTIALRGRAHALYGGGQGTFCARTAKGDECWGWNRGGVAGVGYDSDAITTPTPVTFPKHTHIAFGDIGCYWQVEGAGACWGFGMYGQLVNGRADSLVPVPLTASKHIDQIAIGMFSACSLSRGEVTCWGWNREGQVGNGESSSPSQPMTPTAPVKVRF